MASGAWFSEGSGHFIFPAHRRGAALAGFCSLCHPHHAGMSVLWGSPNRRAILCCREQCIDDAVIVDQQRVSVRQWLKIESKVRQSRPRAR